MGGWNSGRTGGQLTLEGCDSCRLSTRNLRDALRSPTDGTVWRYYRIDGELMHVTLEVRPDRGYLRLQHPSRTSSGPNHMDYTAGLTWTEVGFGARRWWFSCPISGRRCAALYLPRGAQKFAAATTYRLAYGVTRLAEHDRLWHRMRKIARRLGDNDPTPDFPPRKPKWMRLATYDHLLEKWHDAAERRDDIYDTKIAGFLARGARLRG